MATLAFTTTDHKVFTPVSSALGALSEGAGTIVVLIKLTSGTVAAKDYCGLTNSAGSSFYHGVVDGALTAQHITDDTGPSSVESGSTYPSTDTTNWQMLAVDWPASAATETFHWRNQTTLGAWTHSTSAASYGGTKTGPGTAGWLRLGFIGDGPFGNHLEAIVAIWAGTRFANSDYGTWTKTSDLYNHPRGRPTFLCELTSTTLVDLIGGSTYSSGNSSGTTLTGADPPNWTFDGLGPPAVTSNWLSGYSYRMDAPVANPATIANRQLKVPFPGWFLRGHPDGAKIFKSDYSDVHVTTADGITELPVSINTAKTELTVDYANMPVGHTTLFIYYGNASATAPTAPVTLLPRDAFATSAWGSITVDSRLPDQGGAYVAHALTPTGAAIIRNGRARSLDANSKFYYSRTSPPTPDYSVFGTFGINGSPVGSIGIYGRLLDSPTVYSTYRAYLSGGSLFLQGVLNGTSVFQISVAHAFASFPSSRIELRMTGTLIEVYRDGVQVLSQVDSSVTAANCGGFHVGGDVANDSTRFDLRDFLVQDSPSDFTNAQVQIIAANGEVTSLDDASPTDYIWGSDLDQCSLDSLNPDTYDGAATTHSAGVRSSGQKHHMLFKPGEWMLRKGSVGNATLHVHVASNATVAESLTLRCHRLRNTGNDAADASTRHQQWVRTGWQCDDTNGRPTWNTRFVYYPTPVSILWQTAGATNANEIDSTEFVSMTLAPSFAVGYQSLSITPAWVEAWMGDSYSQGLLLKDSTDATPTNNRYVQITSPSQTNSPVLQIDYASAQGDQFSQRKLTTDTYQASTFAVQNRYMILPSENSMGAMMNVNAELKFDMFYISPTGRIRRTLHNVAPSAQMSINSPGWGLHIDPFTGRFFLAGSYYVDQQLVIAYSEPYVLDGISWVFVSVGTVNIFKGSFMARNDTLFIFYPVFGNSRANEHLYFITYTRGIDVWSSSVEVMNMTPGANTTLSTAITSGATMSGAGVINLTATPTNYPAFGSVVIGTEFFWYTGKSGTTLTGVTRAFFGTTAAAHAIGAQVYIDGCEPSYVAVSYDESIDTMRIAWSLVTCANENYSPDFGGVDFTGIGNYAYLKTCTVNYDFVQNRFEDPSGAALTMPVTILTVPVISRSFMATYMMNFLNLNDGTAIVTQAEYSLNGTQLTDLRTARFASGTWTLADITDENFAEASLVRSTPENDIVMTGVGGLGIMRRMVSTNGGVSFLASGTLASHNHAQPADATFWLYGLWCSNCTEQGNLRGRGIVYYQHFCTHGAVYMTAIDFVPPARYTVSTQRQVRKG